jgi:sugar phosphate isomerase/epimerase
MMMTRRKALTSMATVAAGAWAARRAEAADYPAALGVQLYTVRNQLKALDETLGTLASIGYREVETLRPVMAAAGPLLKKHGLTAPSGHLDPWLVTGNRDVWAKMGGAPADVTLDKVIEQAKALDTKYLVLAYLAAAERKTIDDYKRVADQMNEAAAACRKAGIRFAYHHHSFEFGAIGSERPWDVIMARTDKGLVDLEVDVFWLATAGLDPVKTIRDLGPRVRLLHLKDRAKDAPVTFDEGKVPAGAFKEIGAGGLDFPGILRAARDLKVDHCFVEQDQTPGDPAASLRESFKNLQGMKL